MQNRYTVIYLLEDNAGKYIFNRHSNSITLSPSFIRCVYEEDKDLMIDLNIKPLKSLNFTNFNCEDQSIIDDYKKYYAKIYNAKISRRSINVKDYLNSQKFVDLKYLYKDSLRMMKSNYKYAYNIIKKLWFEYYINDVRYRTCKRKDYFSSIRLTKEEAMLFCIARTYFDERYNINSKYLYDYKTYSKKAFIEEIMQYNKIYINKNNDK